MSQHHDPPVGDALRRLDVPDHGPDFWDGLESRLVAGDLTAGGHGSPRPTGADERDAAIMDLDTSEAARRRRTPMLALAAAVAIVVALVVGASVLSGVGDDESTVDVADPTETSVPEDATPAPDDGTADTTVPPETTTAPPDGAAVPHAEEVARSWIDALFAADADGARALLDDASKEQLSPEGFAEYAPGLFEGAAAFAADGIERSVTEVGDVSVVTFRGEVEREGMVETASYPVVVTDTGVHFTLEGPDVSLDPEYAQASGSTLASPLELVVQEEAEAWVWFDDGEPEPLAGRGQVRIDVEAEAGAGTHLVTVVAEQGGRYTARSYTVVVP